MSGQLPIWMHVRTEKHSVPDDNQICVYVCERGREREREREMFSLIGDVTCICDKILLIKIIALSLY